MAIGRRRERRGLRGDDEVEFEEAAVGSVGAMRSL